MTSFRSYAAGGARSVIKDVDDGQYMQESSLTINRNETRKEVESPQNYGFTSVTADRDKKEQQKGGGQGGQGSQGKQSTLSEMGPEAFIMWAGGNRSFPVATVIDDRRHRLYDLGKDAAKGATAMYGLKEWGQQNLITDDGMYMTGNTEKRIKLQLVKNKNQEEQQQQSGGAQPGAQAASAEGGGGGSSDAGGKQQQKKKLGQKTLHKESSDTFVNMDGSLVHTKRGNGNVHVHGNQVVNYHEESKKSTWADDEHTHIRHKAHTLWVDKGGCWSTTPVKQKGHDDPELSGGGGGGGGGTAITADDTPIRGGGAMVLAPTFRDAFSMFSEFKALQAEVASLRQRLSLLERIPFAWLFGLRRHAR
jgi:phage gp45-like